MELYAQVRCYIAADCHGQREAAAIFGISRDMFAKMMRHALPPPGDKGANVMRFRLLYYKDIGSEISMGKGGRLDTLKDLMGLKVTTEEFISKIKKDYVDAASADAFGERGDLGSRTP